MKPRDEALFMPEATRFPKPHLFNLLEMELGDVRNAVREMGLESLS